MSDSLLPVPLGEQAPTTQLTPQAIAEVQALLAQSVASAERAREKIRELTGSQPGKVAQDMLTLINQGTGYLRVPRDSIEAMFKKWAKCRLQMTCPHDHGFNPGPREVRFCKRCDLQFTLLRDGTLEPTEIQL